MQSAKQAQPAKKAKAAQQAKAAPQASKRRNSAGISAKTLLAELQGYVEACVEAFQFSGVVLVTKNGKLLLNEAYGFANLEHQVLNTTNTKFRLASVTKQFTAMAIVILKEQGKLNLHDSISKYVKPCPKHWKKVTIHHLLTHTSGITNYNAFPNYAE